MKRATTLLELQLAIITGMILAMIASQFMLQQWTRFETMRGNLHLQQAKDMVGSSLQYLIWETQTTDLIATADSLGTANGSWQLAETGFFIDGHAIQPFGFHCQLTKARYEAPWIHVQLVLHTDRTQDLLELTFWRRPSW